MESDQREARWAITHDDIIADIMEYGACIMPIPNTEETQFLLHPFINSENYIVNPVPGFNALEVSFNGDWAE